MVVRDYFEVLARRKWIIIITFAVAVAFAIGATLLTPPNDEATTTMRVLSVTGGSSDWVSYDTKQVERLMSTYAEFATSRPVVRELVQKVELENRPEEEWPRIQVEIVVGTELLQIMVEALDPIVARDSANALSQILIDQSRALYIGSGKTAQEILGEQMAQVQTELDQAWSEYEALIAQAPEDTERIQAASRTIALKEETYGTMLEQYERNRVREAVLANTLSVVEPAVAPRRPSKPRVNLNVALGLVVGLAGGIGLAFLVESLDTTLYATEQIKKTADMPVLGQVPSGGRHEQPLLFNGASPQGEAFRRLRTNLFTLGRDTQLRTMLVTSAEPREGKSTIAANLGFAMAQAGRNVIIVDAHLRIPTLHKVFEVSNRVGLSTLLEGKVSASEAIQTTKVSRVHALTSGPLPANPAELVSSPQMSDLVEKLAQEYDVVLLDTPSVLAVTDAAALSQTADGVLLVVERAHARQETVRAARQQLFDVKANPIGVIVNRSKEDSMYEYYQRIPT